MFVCEDCHDKSSCVLNHKNYKESACCETCGKVALCYDCSGSDEISLLEKVAEELFRQDVGAKAGDISWQNVSASVHVLYLSRARTLWLMFKRLEGRE